MRSLATFYWSLLITPSGRVYSLPLGFPKSTFEVVIRQQQIDGINAERDAYERQGEECGGLPTREYVMQAAL